MDEYTERLRADWALSLRSQRRRHGNLSQSALAALSGVPQSRISEIEKQVRLPSEQVKVALAAALLMPVGVLFPYPDDIPVLVGEAA